VLDLGNILPAIAFAIGLAFGLSFDTAGRGRDVVVEERVEERDADEPLTADRGPYAAPPTVPVGPTDDGVHDGAGVPAGTTTREDRTDL
jgi:hypothetical protein